jgi:hypothetical protein
MARSPFSELPDGFFGISRATAALLHDGIGKPPDFRSIGEKTYSAFVKGAFRGELCKKRDWRNLPYALWLGSDRGLAKDRSLFERYFRDHLMPAISSRRRPMKWVKPLLFTYINEFTPGDKNFAFFANRLRDTLKNERVSSHPTIRRLHGNLNFFDPDKGPQRTGFSIIESGKSIRAWSEEHDLWLGFSETPFAEHAFKASLNVPPSQRKTLTFVKSVIQWFQIDTGTLRYPHLRPFVANALLLEWPLDKAEFPHDDLKNLLIDFFKRHYGDPTDMRSFKAGNVQLNAGAAENRWRDANPKCPQIIRRWMVGDTLKAFFKILEKTADEIWMYRQKFWLAYYNRGLIDEAWVALGPTAQSYVRREFNDRKLQYADLEGTNAQQSVLLLKMSNIIFCEWSHRGRLRAGKDGAPSVPQLYEDSYWAAQLRFNSMDFNEGLLEDPGLVHFSSQTGGWQDRARNFIRKHLGHNLPLSQVS